MQGKTPNMQLAKAVKTKFVLSIQRERNLECKTFKQEYRLEEFKDARDTNDAVYKMNNQVGELLLRMLRNFPEQ